MAGSEVPLDGLLRALVNNLGMAMKPGDRIVSEPFYDLPTVASLRGHARTALNRARQAYRRKHGREMVRDTDSLVRVWAKIERASDGNG
jgi:hypothetical protein